MERRRAERSDIALPPFPLDLLPYLRMSIKDLSPAEYWECSKHDYELANDVQAAWRQGAEDAREKKRDDDAAAKRIAAMQRTGR